MRHKFSLVRVSVDDAHHLRSHRGLKNSGSQMCRLICDQRTTTGVELQSAPLDKRAASVLVDSEDGVY